MDDDNQLGAINEADPDKITWKVAEEININHSTIALINDPDGKIKKTNTSWMKIKFFWTSFEQQK